ncbi:MAG: hypothetical protein ACOX7N_06820 [Lawsonibacter sp.]|jgi:hypothetical protein
MAKDIFLITLLPQQMRAIRGWNVTPAHLAYRIGRGPHLFRASGDIPLRGGIMVVDNQGFDGLGNPAFVCQEILRECQARGFSGCLLDFEGRLPPLEQIAAQLDHTFSSREMTLYVPEPYGTCAPHAKVLIPSALSGGSLAVRLEESTERFGQERIALALERVAEDFFLPSPSGSGTALTQEELRALLNRLRPSVFFSNELCARYFTYMSPDSGAHFVLFDDGDTLRRKVEVARKVGIHTFLIPWEEAQDCLQQLGIQRLPTLGEKGSLTGPRNRR